MKKVGTIFVLAISLFLMSGCVKQTVDMKISKDGKIDLTVISAISKDFLEDSEGSIAQREDFEKLGYEVEDYDDSEKVGVKATKTYSLEEVSDTKETQVHLEDIAEESLDGKQLFQLVSENFLGQRYKGNFIIDLTKVGNSPIEGSEISYSVTLPSKAKSHNADEVKGNTLTWHLEIGEVKEIQYEFMMNDRTYLLVIAGILGLAIIVAGIILFISKHKKA